MGDNVGPAGQSFLHWIFMALGLKYTLLLPLAAATTSQPKPSELAEGTSMALVAPMVGMLLMIPAYALATLGLIVRSLMAGSERLSETRLPGNR